MNARVTAAARALLLIAGILPPLIALVRIVRGSVNVPYQDEWNWTGLAVASRTGTLTWDALWAPHNGHRQIVTNLLFLGIDRLGGWNVVREELVGLAFIVVGLIALYRLVSRTFAPLTGAAAFAVFSWLIAGPIAYENFLSGWQMGWQICVAAVLIVVERLSAPLAPRWTVWFAGATAIVASFSAAMGLVMWPCGLLVLAGRRAPRRTLATWCGLWALTVFVYFAGYGYEGGPARAHELTDALLYALTFLGTPLRSAEMTLGTLQAIGALLLLVFAGALAAARRARTEPAQLWPWVALGAYALGGALFTALTRSGIGIYQAQSPRYVSISQFLIIADCALLVPRAAALRRPRWRLAGALLASIFLVSFARSVQLGWIVWRDVQWHRGVELRGIARHDRSVFAQSYPDPTYVERSLDQLRAVNDGPLAER